MSKRPHIICLMMTSVDGKILSEKWGNSKQVQTLTKSFEEVHESIGNKSWIVGRTTMEKDFTHYAKPIHKETTTLLDRKDYVADPNASSFAVAIDGKAKLGWENAEMLGEHVITVLTESVNDSYLAHLRDIGVSYVFGGKDTIDLHLVLEKLNSLFGIETLMLEGGGHINGSFLNEGLIDEFYQIILPLVDGRTATSSVFEVEENSRKFNAAILKLESVKQLHNDVVLLKYKAKEQV